MNANREPRIESTSEPTMASTEGGAQDGESGLTRRSLLTRSALAASAGAVLYTTPRVALAQPGGILSPAFRPTFTAISNSNPSPGDMVTITGANLPTDPARGCTPGFIPVSVSLGTGGGGQDELTAITANAPGTFTPMIGIGQDWLGFGDLGVPHPAVTGLNLAQPGSLGNVVEVLPQNIVAAPFTVTIGSGPGTALPLSLSGGMICIDFNPFSWAGGETVEVELHFDVPGRHCDYVYKSAIILSAGDASTCAALVGAQVQVAMVMLDSDCADITFNVVGGQLKFFFPGGSITNLHPLSHVTVT